ncbi:MAG TPA: tetratricopeptide repeat protein [Polyangiaceae bacterium]|nr:tetratricopeptide repeat protein [Polyangiaceae bacterium]
MRKLTILLGLSACVAMATAAQAEDKKAAGPAAAKAGNDSAPIIGSDGVRRDPKGVKGISPYIELIIKGDHAYVARDFDGAIAAFREAIKAEPEKPLAHYRLGAAQLAKGDQKEAEAAFVNGLRFAGRDGSLKGKLIFALADLRERQKNNDEAIGRWKEYSKNAEDEKGAITYPATATERISRNEAWKKNAADSAEVKARIAKRLQEADAASRKSASDPKNK